MESIRELRRDSAPTPLKSKRAWSMLKWMFALKKKAEADSRKQRKMWDPERKLPKVYFSYFELVPFGAWRGEDGTIYINSSSAMDSGEMSAGYVKQRMKRVQQQTVQHWLSLCMTQTQVNIFINVMALDYFPNNLEKYIFSVEELPGLSMKEVCCFLELLLGTRQTKLVKKYGKELLDSFMVCDLNPIELERARLLISELEATAADEEEKIRAIKREAFEREEEVRDKAISRMCELVQAMQEM